MTRDHIEILESIIGIISTQDMNEADTRHKVIDLILHDILAWPRILTKCEPITDRGRIDYLLTDEKGDDLLVVEAKREGHFFDLPSHYKGKISITAINKILSDDNIRDALIQAQQYCLDTDCSFGSITNGDQWIFFVPFERGTKWSSLKCYIIPSIRIFKDNYIEIYNLLSYKAIAYEKSLDKLLLQKTYTILPKFNPKNYIKSYDYEVRNNRLAAELRPIAKEFFDSLQPDKIEFMEKCYVNPTQFSGHYAGFKEIIQDRISPFFKEHNVVSFTSNSDGGKFGKTIESKVKRERRSDVVILFGGKGAGKSTFLKKFFFHSPPAFIRNSAIVVCVDLLSISEDKDAIKKFMWDEVVRQLDTENILESDRDRLLELYSDKFEIAKKQRLKGYDEGTSSYTSRLNSAVTKWKNDKQYTAQSLSRYWRTKKRETIVILDNTDQFLQLQDYCFGLAQEVSRQIDCLSIISMREERFYASSIRGVLDAYHNHGFHLTSPDTRDVFTKRLRFVLNLINRDPKSLRLYTTKDAKDVIDFFRVFLKGFVSDVSPLNSFMSACTHGNIRFALDIFRDYILSGYLAVDEMIGKDPIWTIQNHQVIKPMMTPKRFYYEEKLSKFPNLFQLRDIEYSSHFSAIRILHKLHEIFVPKVERYIDIPVLRKDFVGFFNMNNDFEKNLNVLLKYGIIESDNRIDKFSADVDRVTITAYGVFFYKYLIKEFVYLDLICSDCILYSEECSHSISTCCNAEFDMYIAKNPLDRVKSRLEKVEIFLTYLNSEEDREFEQYQLPESYVKIMPIIIDHYKEEKEIVLASATKNYG